MCGPPALALAAAAVATVGTGVGALQSAAQSRYEAKVADRNARLERESAELSIENTRQAALAHYRQLAQMKGAQRVAAAANGVSIDFGSALDVQADTAMLGQEDARRIYEAGDQERRGFEINTMNYRSQALASRTAASGALIKGAFDVGSTALSGAQQYSTLRNARDPLARLQGSARKTMKANPRIF